MDNQAYPSDDKGS